MKKMNIIKTRSVTGAIPQYYVCNRLKSDNTMSTKIGTTLFVTITQVNLFSVLKLFVSMID